MADAAPSTVYTPRPPTRPRRSTARPRTSYRRSPGAASRPIPRAPPSAPSGASRLLGLARFLPFRAFVDLFLGGVSSNAERAAAAERAGLDYLTERQLSRLARGTERRVRVGRAAASARAAVATAAEAGLLRRDAPARLSNPLTQPAALPEPRLVSVAAELLAPGLAPQIAQQLAAPAAPAAPRPSSSAAPAPLLELPLLPQFFTGTGPSSRVTENPLLTPFNAPGVGLLPQSLGMLEPLPQTESQRCRCRRRKAGKPGKGFFVINRRGQERRRYWS